MATNHPCLTCGACCATYRVQFYWREAEKRDSDHPVPLQLTEELSPLHRCMKGTNEKHSRGCVALSGRIGRQVACTIYTNRPTPCRDFGASYESGAQNPRCDEARMQHGLPALRREDWEEQGLGASSRVPLGLISPNAKSRPN